MIIIRYSPITVSYTHLDVYKRQDRMKEEDLGDIDFEEEF